LVIELNPSWISIFELALTIRGRRFDSNDPTSPETFEASYRLILEQAAKRTHAHIILCEPFLLPMLEGQSAWWDDLEPK